MKYLLRRGVIRIPIFLNGRFTNLNINEMFDQEITMEPDEYLITIRGAAGNYFGPNVITSLVFVTNKRSYAAFGNRGSNIVPFNVPVQSGRVIGFHGRAAQYLNAIGLVMAAPPCLPCTI